ncbi:MAG TPA: peptidoglycan-associated lipoprotein Pal [Acidobacteriota bacterium]|nr:peptidoglycan-associated lipoprotein Pal [Acidobacteriota bacterium]
MRRRPYIFTLTTTALLSLIIIGTGCGRRIVEPPPPVAEAEKALTAPSPTISLTVSPAAIERGQSATLSWKSSNATEVNIDSGVGTVEAAGSRTVSPGNSTTYIARAAGPGGTATAEARVTVTAPTAITPPTPSAVSDISFFETNIEDIFFDLDDHSIRADASKILRSNARALAERPGIRITIAGHCDERGSSRYNLALGDQRANSARDYLISLGVDATRIETISYGEERPFCPESTEACWQLNRRGQFIMR